jgi:hypothetical protein
LRVILPRDGILLQPRAAAEPGEEIAAHARQQVIARQRAIAGDGIHDDETRGRAEGPRHGDRAVELDDGDGVSCASAS